MLKKIFRVKTLLIIFVVMFFWAAAFVSIYEIKEHYSNNYENAKHSSGIYPDGSDKPNKIPMSDLTPAQTKPN